MAVILVIILDCLLDDSLDMTTPTISSFSYVSRPSQRTLG